MRNLIKLHSLCLSSSNKLFHSQLSEFQICFLSSLSRSSKLSQSKKTQQTHLKNQAETSKSNTFGLLFNEITAILGTDHLNTDRTQSGNLISKEINVEGNKVKEEHPDCTQGVCRNAEESVLQEKDVSPEVHKITQIVRAEKSPVSMEERLENLGVGFDPEVVEKVLKRCFKVPCLALRFFNWVKLRDGFRHTTRTYNTMLYIAGEAGEFRLVEKLVEDMEKNLCEKDIKTWTILISLYGNAKLISKALLVFNNMRKCGCEPDSHVYMKMIRALCAAGKDDIAMEFYKEMVQKEMGIDMSLYKMLMNCVARSGDIAAVHSNEALEWIRDLKSKDVTLDAEYFETLVKGLCRADRIVDALEIVDIMKRRHIIDGKVYGIIISGTSSGWASMKKGCVLYDEMLERGVEPDTVAITAMVAGHISQNRISEAWKVFKSMEDWGIRPTWKSYSVFIKELGKISRTDEIFKVLNEMQASKMDIRDEIFDWAISYLEKKGDVDSIEKIKQMQRICNLYPQEGEIPCTDASTEQELNIELNSNQLEAVRMDCHLVVPLPRNYDEQDVQEICRILSSSTDWCLIQEALEKCNVQFTPDLVVEILHNCNMHGSAALHFFSWVGKQAGYSHTTETYNMAIKIAGRGKDFKHMRNLFYEMRRRGYSITSYTWTIMIMQYGRTGLTEIALNIFGEMKANGCNPTGSTYKYLLMILCRRKGRKVDEAIKLFEEMIHAGHIPDKELVEAYLGCLCKVSRLLDARRCTDSLRRVGFTIPLSHSLYIRALCRAGKLEEAQALVDEVGAEGSTLDQYTYGSIVHGLLQKGRMEEALTKVDSMKQAGINPTVHVYTSLMAHFMKEKQIERALEVFQKMQQEGCQPTIVTYSELLRGYMNMGKVSDAWNIFHRMKLKGPLPDFKTYSIFITSLCKVGRSEEALQLISEMTRNGIVPSTVNFREVFYGLNREGKQDLAHTVLQQKLALRSKRKFLT
uniref:Pentacotripeptide-repeat region of PRORP domain-containing protein n=1 Tax=Fagus sylvatica TaxID=28930 RepID=A0A2N9HKL7_FAGSY